MSKKLISGDQPPRNGWARNKVMEVKVTASATCPMINVRVGEGCKTSTWMIDSGAPVSLLDSESFQEKFPGKSLSPIQQGVRYSTANGSPLVVLGSFSTNFWFGKEGVEEQVHVCTGVTRKRLIGTNILSKFDHWEVDNVRVALSWGIWRYHW